MTKKACLKQSPNLSRINDTSHLVPESEVSLGIAGHMEFLVFPIDAPLADGTLKT